MSAPRREAVNLSFNSLARDLERYSLQQSPAERAQSPSLLGGLIDRAETSPRTAMTTPMLGAAPVLSSTRGPAPLPAARTGSGRASIAPAIGGTDNLSAAFNRKIRRLLLSQSYWTNRFVGSPQATHAERSYREHTGEYSRRPALRRAACFSILLAVATGADFIVVRKELSLFMARTVLPVCLLLGAVTAGCSRRLAPWWRLQLMLALYLAYVSILLAELSEDPSGWLPRDRDIRTHIQLIWLLLMLSSSALFFALDFVQVAALLLLQFCSFHAGVLALFARWWVATGRGPWTFGELTATNGTTSSQVLAYTMLISVVFLAMLLFSARQLNRSERKAFVNSHVLLSRVSAQNARISRTEIELLALFSNPKQLSAQAFVQLGLRPLAPGQELKFLLRAIPNETLAIEAAASLSDVTPALTRHNPRAIHFSGHSVNGSLVFELPNGKVELPSPSDFISQLTKRATPRLELVFLNGCLTAELGYQLAALRPELTVVCWASITEDSAARSFAQGFYDAVGAHARDADRPIRTAAAYIAGVHRFEMEGCTLGDPSTYLHGAGHPHLTRPEFHSCPGCCPPVHGVVVALSCLKGGVVHSLHVSSTETEVEPETPVNSPRGGSAAAEEEVARARENWAPVSLEDLRAADVGVLLGRTVEAVPPPPPSP